jgi:hypothetical protein
MINKIIDELEQNPIHVQTMAHAEKANTLVNMEALDAASAPRADFPSSVPSLPDFIDTYADYADVIEAPREMHEAVAIQLLAATLNRNGVTISLGAVTHTFDLWLLLLSGSGMGRSTLVSMAAPILERAELTSIQRNETWGSPQALMQQMAENTSGLYIWGEMSEKLRVLGAPRFEGTREWITDRYNNLAIPETLRYRNTGRKGNTPPIVFKKAPRINILATSSNDWLFTNLAREDSTGGFLPRWMILATEGSSRTIPIPQRPNPALIEPLAERLKQVSNLRGQADLSDIQPDYEQWYGDAKNRFDNHANRQLAVPYFNRHRAHILQLAVIYEVSMSGRLRVSRLAWHRAEKMAKKVEKNIFALLSTGMNAEGYALKRIADAVRGAGDAGMSKSELTKKFQYIDKRDRDRRIQTLEDTGEIISFKRKPASGRPAEYFVHEDFAESYASRNPADKRRLE